MSQPEKSSFLGTEPVAKLLFRLAIPTVAAQIVNLLYNVVDRIYIGHMPEGGALALTGLGVCMPIIMVVSAFSALICSGGAPRASISMGQGDYDHAEKTMAVCFTAQTLLSLVLTALLLIFNRRLLLSFGASGNTIEYASAYMGVYALGTVFVQLTLGMNAFITAQGFTKISMISVLIGATLNIILDPIFIFVLNMGVRGAALATIISQCVSCSWALLFLSGKRTGLRLRVKNMGIRPALLLPCLALGVAPFVMQASESVIFVCFNSSLLRYGGDIAVGAMTILISAMQFALLPVQGVSQGAQPIISYNYGAGSKARVKQAFRLLLTVNLSYTMVFWALIMSFPQLFAGMFSPDDALISFTAWALRIYCAAIGIFGIQMACQMTFLALGNAVASTIVAVMRKLVLLVPLIYIIPAFTDNKVLGVYLAEPVSDTVSVIFAATLFFFQFRKALSGMDDKEEVKP